MLLPHRLIPPIIKRISGWCGCSNLSKILIKSVAAKRVAATFVAACTLLENSCFLTFSD
jgi:hypothetical protein